jgi:hypothetical protein
MGSAFDGLLDPDPEGGKSAPKKKKNYIRRPEKI